MLVLLVGIITVLALGSGILLLSVDAAPFWLRLVVHAPVSATPLLLIGVAFLGMQLLLNPRGRDIVKALMVASAFLLWGIDQLLPVGWGATTLGDVVIVLYVLDLGWMLLERLSHEAERRPTQRTASRVSRSSFRHRLLPILPPIDPSGRMPRASDSSLPSKGPLASRHAERFPGSLSALRRQRLVRLDDALQSSHARLHPGRCGCRQSSLSSSHQLLAASCCSECPCPD